MASDPPVSCPSCGAPSPGPAQMCAACQQRAAPVPPPSGDLETGEVLCGAWRIERVVGKGGMGTVYLAKDLRLGRKLAVKSLLPEVATEEFVQRFEREARVLANLDHPNIVAVHGFDKHRGIPFIVMRYLEGVSLRQYVRERGGKLPPAEVLRLGGQLCDALAYLGQHGVIHRDLKPGNLMVNPAGNVTLFDLGIARPRDSTLTKTGIVYGTPGYMAPELIVGEKHLDGRADQYALGVILFELLTGWPPFSDPSNDSLLRAHLMNPRPDPRAMVPEVPEAMARAVMRAMAVDPAGRFPDAGALRAALEGAFAGDSSEPITLRQQPLRLEDPQAPASPLASEEPPTPIEVDVSGVGVLAPAALGADVADQPTRASSRSLLQEGAAPSRTGTRPQLPSRTGERPQLPATEDGASLRSRTGTRPQLPAAGEGASLRSRTGERPQLPATGDGAPRSRTGARPQLAPAGAQGPAPALGEVADLPTRTASRLELAAVPSAALGEDLPTRAFAGLKADRAARWRRGAIVASVLGVILFAVAWIVPTEPGPQPAQPLIRLHPAAEAPPPPAEPHVPSATSDVVKRKQQVYQASETAREERKKLERMAEPAVRRKEARASGVAGSGELQVTVFLHNRPVVAQVSVNGAPPVATPMYLPLPPGTHRLEIIRRPFPTSHVPVVVKANSTVRLEVELAPLAALAQ